MHSRLPAVGTFATPALITTAIGRGLLEYGPDEVRRQVAPGSVEDPGFVMMKKVKDMLDPQSLLNRGRLYGW